MRNILKEEQNSMIYQVFKATLENPLKNDFVSTCQKYLKCLDINLSPEKVLQLYFVLVGEDGVEHSELAVQLRPLAPALFRRIRLRVATHRGYHILLLLLFVICMKSL